MLEVKVTIEAPALTEALQHLATAMSGAAHATTVVASQLPLVSEPVSAQEPAPATPAPVQAPVTAPLEEAPPISTPPVAAPTYKLEDLQRAMAPLFDAGKQQAVRDAVTGMGYATLFEIPAEKYGELAAILRGLGAQI